MRKDPIFFIKRMWSLVPQPVKPAYKEFVKTAPFKKIRAHMFEKFEKGKHITWQQWLLFRAVRKAIQGKASRKIAIKSGHGTGKSSGLAILILWFLWCFKNAQVPCTAPGHEQMHDVLWKEIQLWLQRMPEYAQAKYDWSSSYVRVSESPATWFARARTARKEAPEALAGIHADHVLMVVDEASGVAQEIFKTAKGALTNKNVLFIMIGNPTRIVGYFYDAFHKLKENWQNLWFNGEESPIVDQAFIDEIIKDEQLDPNDQDALDSNDEYRIRVKGLHPREDSLDDQDYVPLLRETDLHFTDDEEMFGRKKLGSDPSGEGNDMATNVIRDRFKARVAGEHKSSDAKKMAQKVLTLQVDENIAFRDITVDNFGEGANVAQEIALAVPGARIRAVNVGDTKSVANKKRFMNKRAECYWRLRMWLRAGGELVGNLDKWRELLTIRYRRGLSGKIQVMSKKDMRKAGYKSPNRADALSLTFYDKDPKKEADQEDRREEEESPKRVLKRRFGMVTHSTTTYPGGR